VDLTPFAVLRALGELDHVGVSTGDAEALVDVGASVTNIVVHQNGTPRFVRILLMGGDTITEAVADRMGVPADQAETVKQEMGLAPAGSVPEQAHPAGRVIETTASAFIDEVRGSLDYYLAQPHAMPLRRLVVSGGGARLEGLVQRLSTATRLPVEPGTPISRLRVGKTGLTQEQLSYVDPVAVVPVGLAMGVAA
jgi:type IV pilus assembly protein PilM